MFDYKTIATSLIVSVVVVVVFGMVGGKDESLGATYRMPNSDLSAKSLKAAETSTTATSTVYATSASATQGGQVILEDSDGSGCSAVTAANGTVAGSVITCP